MQMIDSKDTMKMEKSEMHHCQKKQINDSSNLKTWCNEKSEKTIKEQSYIHYDNKANTREIREEEFNFQEMKAKRVK